MLPLTPIHLSVSTCRQCHSAASSGTRAISFPIAVSNSETLARTSVRRLPAPLKDLLPSRNCPTLSSLASLWSKLAETPDEHLRRPARVWPQLFLHPRLRFETLTARFPVAVGL